MRSFKAAQAKLIEETNNQITPIVDKLGPLLSKEKESEIDIIHEILYTARSKHARKVVELSEDEDNTGMTVLQANSQFFFLENRVKWDPMKLKPERTLTPAHEPLSTDEVDTLKETILERVKGEVTTPGMTDEMKTKAADKGFGQFIAEAMNSGIGQKRIRERIGQYVAAEKELLQGNLGVKLSKMTLLDAE